MFDIEYVEEGVIKFNGRKFVKENFDDTFCCRSIFYCGGFVVKIDEPEEKFLKYKQSRNEKIFWNKVKRKKDSVYFVPILHSKYIREINGYAVVQPEVIPLDTDVYDCKNEFIAKIYYLEQKYGFVDILETKNLSDKDGEPYIFDYGL